MTTELASTFHKQARMDLMLVFASVALAHSDRTAVTNSIVSMESKAKFQ
jgi:hypothetical protein